MRAVVVMVGVIDLTAGGLSCNVSLSMASGKVPVVVVVGKGLVDWQLHRSVVHGDLMSSAAAREVT